MDDILIISNYYPPEKGAAANRIEQLALKLRQNNYTVSVLCPLANYPKGKLFEAYRGKFSADENRDGIRVKRLWVYPSVSRNVFVRILSVLSFSSVLFFYLVFKKTPKKVIVQSPPLPLSFIAVLVLSVKRKKIILNISDLWPLAAIELGAIRTGSFSHRSSLWLEKYIYKKATVVLGQSDEIIAHVQKTIPGKNCFLYRNFPDHPDAAIDLPTPEVQTVKLFYAGLLGVAQGMLELCNRIDLSPPGIELHLFGDGAERPQIEALIASGKVNRIYFHGMLERNALHERIRAFDVALVPLTTRIYGSVPSKIFEYGALGFPILYFGGGEGESIVSRNNMGWVVPVGDYTAFNVTLRTISAMDRTELQLMKKTVLMNSRSVFDLDAQIRELIADNVF